MEKEKLINLAMLRRLALKLPLSIILMIPLWGMLVTSNEVLAEVELGDPVELYKTHPTAMAFFRWCVICGIIFAFTPFKRLCAMATGLAIGGLAFYAMDLYHQLGELSKMGLSSKPLTEMVALSSSGEWLMRWCICAGIVQALSGLASPSIRLWKCWKNKVKCRAQAD